VLGGLQARQFGSTDRHLLYRCQRSPAFPTYKVIHDLFVGLAPSNSNIAYFEQVHPLYPFLNRKEFEEKALKPEVSKLVELNAPFSALYHSVLALGCQYCEGGAFDPGKGKAWKLFQIALGLFPEIIVPQQTLTSVQVCLNSMTDVVPTDRSRRLPRW